MSSHRRGPLAAEARRYLVAALACAVFAAVYESFGHGVYSAFMVGLFAWPLVLGMVPALVAARLGMRVPAVVRRAWGLGVVTLTVGSAFRGVLEIYGTTSPLARVYWVLGLSLLVLAVALWLVAEAGRMSRAA